MKLNTFVFVAGAVLLNITGSLGQIDVCGRAPLNSRIVGGANATAGSWPWQVSIHRVSTGQFFYSGTLINKDWVLSAATIFVLVPTSDIVVYLGRLNQSGSNPNEISRTVTKVIKHHNYNSIGSNVALLQLSSSVNFTDYIKPVCLAAAGSIFVDGTKSWVTGWDSLSSTENKFPDILQEVETPVVSNVECNAAYGGLITNDLMCAGFLDEGGKAPCAGDAGAPLVIRQGSLWIQSGVAVFSIGCGEPGYPTAYVRVSEYQDWISNFTKRNLPGFVPYPLILTAIDGASINLLSFPIALTFSIIPLILLHFY